MSGGQSPVPLLAVGALAGAVGTFAYQRYAEREREAADADARRRERERERGRGVFETFRATWGEGASDTSDGSESADQRRGWTSGSRSDADAFASFWDSAATGGGDIPDWLLSSREVSVDVLQHLVRVYAALGASLLAACAGTVVQSRVRAPASLTTLASVGLAFSLASRARLWKLLGLGFLQGMSLGDLMRVAFAVNSQIVPMAAAGSALVFGSFATAASVATRRSLLYLYGGLGSALSLLTFASFGNLYFRSVALHRFNVYVGLATLVGYVMADSQLIIERADRGDKDYVAHASLLLTDAVGIFARLVLALLDQQRSAAARGRRDRSRRDPRDRERGRDVAEDAVWEER